MTNKFNNINNISTDSPFFQTVEISKIEKHLNNSKNSKLLILNLEDLNTEIINQLKATECKIVLLNENFEIVEDAKAKQVQLTIDGCKKSVTTDQIIRLESDSNYTTIYLNNHPEPILTSKSLKHYVDKLDPELFIRPHRSHLLNRNFIKSYNTQNKKYLSLRDGSEIPVSRRKQRTINQIMKESPIQLFQ